MMMVVDLVSNFYYVLSNCCWIEAAGCVFVDKVFQVFFDFIFKNFLISDFLKALVK